MKSISKKAELITKIIGGFINNSTIFDNYKFDSMAYQNAREELKDVIKNREINDEDVISRMLMRGVSISVHYAECDTWDGWYKLDKNKLMDAIVKYNSTNELLDDYDAIVQLALFDEVRFG